MNSLKMRNRKCFHCITMIWIIKTEYFHFRLKLKKNQAINLQPFSSTSVKSKNVGITLYPYQSDELKVVFVYGTNFKRQRYQIVLTELGKETFYLVSMFMLLSAALVCFVRRKLRLRRDGLSSALLDVQIAFFAGGNLRMRNKFERWIFEILLIASFFLMIFWLDAVLFPSFLIQDKSIKTFDQLAETNAPIFIFKFLQADADLIAEMMRFENVHKQFNVEIDLFHFQEKNETRFWICWCRVYGHTYSGTHKCICNSD